MGLVMFDLLVWITVYDVGWSTISVHCYYPLLCYLLFLLFCTVVWDLVLKVMGYSNLSSPLGIMRWFPPLCLFALAYFSIWFLFPSKYLFGLLTFIDRPLKGFNLFDIRISRYRRSLPLDFGLLLSFIVINFVVNIYLATDSVQAFWKHLGTPMLFLLT